LITAVRICRDIHANTALNGEGAKRFGGRWNSPGRPVVYLAGSAALAILEIAVHTGPDGLKLPFVVIDVECSSTDAVDLPAHQLPADWPDESTLQQTRQIGDTWLASKRSLLLRVPSAVVPREFNYLLNPLHPRFTEIRVGKPHSIAIDPRIKN
jgi:RES domain-containing protein